MQSRHGAAKQSVGKLATIAPREEQANSGTDTNPPTPSLTDLPRTRLPPRSRSGCWTCRTRKVKCDENRPRCNQCARLGHRCDYSPKLAFKDETPKIIEKYLDESSRSEWIPLMMRFPTRDFLSPEDDHLPPFTDLVLDEDWQTKAKFSSPGTYFVVANTSSFVIDSEGLSVSSGGRDDFAGENEVDFRHNNTIVDSRTLIIGSFEETCQQMSSLQVVTTFGQESETTTPNADTPVLLESGQQFGLRSSPEQPYFPRKASSMSEVQLTQNDLWLHYRRAVRKYLLPVPGISLSIATQIEDAFEREAKRFPPLEHALMAITALSLSHEYNSQAVNALQHYDRAIGPLRHEHDPASDGALLTHFVLLLYEVAGNEPFWAYHMASLRGIIRTRRQTLQTEPYPYAVWCTCLIDINASMSGAGQGDFINAIMCDGMVPTADEMLHCSAFFGGHQLFNEEPDMFRAAWDLQCNVHLVAAEIARFGADRRAARAGTSHRTTHAPRLTPEEQSQLRRLRDMLNNTWTGKMGAELLNAIREGTLSPCAQSILNAARATYYSCIIYTQRHLWPGPHLEVGYETELVHDAARSILEIAHGIVQGEHSEQRFIVLPLLLAATVLDTTESQNHIQRLMQRIAAESLGANTGATLRLLGAIHEQQQQQQYQQQHGMLSAPFPSIDLFGIMSSARIHVIHFGL